MGTQYENITVTISGVNPQTKVVSVPVDTTTGSGSATVTYTGVNGGSDSLVATGTMAGVSYTSPAALVNWQTSNGQLQIGPVTAYMWNDSNHSASIQAYPKFNINDPQVGNLGIPNYTTASSSPSGLAVLSTSYGYVGSASGNSLMFDIGGAGDPTDTMWEILGPTGAYLGTTDPFPGTRQNWNMVLLTNLLVPTAGVHTFNVLNKNCVNIGIGGRFGGTPFLSPITSPYGGQTLSAYSGYPLVGAAPGNNVPYPMPTTAMSANYPAAGVYPIEVNWDFWYHSGRSMQITGDSGALITPVSSIISVPAASTPTGNLIITPAGGPTNFGFTGNAITLTVQVSGITFTSKSYCPVLEGQTGNLTLYNDPSNPVFNFQTYNGQPVSKTATIPAGDFSLSSADNSAYSGLFGVTFDGTNFNLNYNGNTANPTNASRVVSTSLIVAAADIAWFNSVNNSFDLFAVSGTTGGVTYNFEVDYMNRPSVSSISPTTINADGNSYTLAIALNKAFSPQQQGAFNTGNTVTASYSIPGASTGTPVAVTDSGGWLTGWNAPFTAPVATTNQTLTVNLTVNGTLTYLSGNTFVTNTVTYVSGVIGTITANGTSFVAPTAYSFALSPTGPGISYLVTSATATGQVFTAGGNDSTSLTFFYQPYGTSTHNTLGAGTQTSSVPATVSGVSGYLHTFTLTFNPNSYLAVAPGDYIGFNATDNVSSLTCSYTSSTAYYIIPSGGGGGGGGY